MKSRMEVWCMRTDPGAYWWSPVVATRHPARSADRHTWGLFWKISSLLPACWTLLLALELGTDHNEYFCLQSPCNLHTVRLVHQPYQCTQVGLPIRWNQLEQLPLHVACDPVLVPQQGVRRRVHAGLVENWHHILLDMECCSEFLHRTQLLLENLCVLVL